jgi:hypothetical protein
MSDELLPALFQIATGLSFALVLVIGTLARKSIRDWTGRLAAFGVVAVALGFFLLSRATGGTMSAGAELIAAAGAAFFAAALLVAASLIIRARSAD